MEYKIGDIVKTKKSHPCGSCEWEIVRVGLDFKLKCQGCRTCSDDSKRKSFKDNKKIKKEYKYEDT
ncbi:MAG: DUF951 domain-containing protein [Clostridia bacterium]|nr:DUF951 domain-containing protein [Clostridia bacterium]